MTITMITMLVVNHQCNCRALHVLDCSGNGLNCYQQSATNGTSSIMATCCLSSSIIKFRELIFGAQFIVFLC